MSFIMIQISESNAVITQFRKIIEKATITQSRKLSDVSVSFPTKVQHFKRCFLCGKSVQTFRIWTLFGLYYNPTAFFIRFVRVLKSEGD